MATHGASADDARRMKTRAENVSPDEFVDMRIHERRIRRGA